MFDAKNHGFRSSFSSTSLKDLTSHCHWYDGNDKGNYSKMTLSQVGEVISLIQMQKTSCWYPHHIYAQKSQSVKNLGQPVEKPRWTHLKSMNPWRSWAILAIHGTLSERRREKFPIFFRWGKLPLGPYKVQGPQAQARKKSECPGDKPDTRESSWEIFGVTIFMFKKHNKI